MSIVAYILLFLVQTTPHMVIIDPVFLPVCCGDWWYGMVWDGVVSYGVVWCGVVWCGGIVRKGVTWRKCVIIVFYS